jgi:hypothetical protein
VDLLQALALHRTQWAAAAGHQLGNKTPVHALLLTVEERLTVAQAASAALRHMVARQATVAKRVTAAARAMAAQVARAAHGVET